MSGHASQSSGAGGASGDVDVVIVSFNSREMTAECVEELTDPRVARIIVVDNGSTDATTPYLRERFGERVEVVVLERGVGFAAACNVGARSAGARLLLFLNSDILATPGAISRMVDALDGDAGAVAAGGRLVNPGDLSTQTQYKPRRFPGFAVLATTLLGVEEFWPDNPVTRRHTGVDTPETHTQAVEQLAGAALLVPRERFERVGGFDERFWFWYEDIDLLQRLAQHGRILWVPDAPLRHIGGASFAKWDKVRSIRSLHHGLIQYADAQLPRGQKAALGVLVAAVSLPRVLLFGRSRPDEARAWRDVMRGGFALVRGRRPAPLAGP